jgi:ABC-2 type transport system ATP-binding protein
MAYALEVESLSRVFSSKKDRTIALENVDLNVEEGELFGLLGPNGAGKTTLIKILCTLLLPTSGTAKVLGHDVAKEPNKIRSRINMVSGGEVSGYGLLTVRENLWMFSQFYGIPGSVA